MQEVDVETWEEFEQQIRELRNSTKTSLSGLLFRGQGNCSWPLDTTLERNGQKKYLVKSYYGLIARVKPQIEAFTGLE